MAHLTIHLYQMILDGMLPPRTLARALHRHLLESCPRCAAEWRAARAAGVVSAAPPDAGGEPRVEPGDAVAFSPQARRIEDAARRVRSTRRQARRDLASLLELRPERREERIVNARTRFRSRAFVELLIEHSRERVRSAPRAAARLLELVPTTLLWIPGGLDAPWANVLQVRAEAHRANALRVAGDLAAAERVLGGVRRRLASVPLTEAAAYGEVASLEASLRWDQARHDEAMALLDQAVLVYQEAGEREGLARVLVQRASIAQELERPGQALADLERARGLVDPERQTFLFLFTVVGIVPILLDAERYEDARRVLAEAQDAFEAVIEPWWALRLRHLEGRVQLGLGDLPAAERLLDDARQGFLDQELPYEGAGVSLDLALLYLRQGRTAEVRRVTRQVAPVFRALGVERAVLATLMLLERAAAVDAATLDLVTTLRRSLEDAQRSGGRRRPSGDE